MFRALVLSAAIAALTRSLPAQIPEEGDFVLSSFQFASGGQLPKLNLHYTTFGHPACDPQGHISNAVLILHGASGSGHQFLAPQFRDVLFKDGQLLDASKYFIILPDDIGHGKSSKPSDGLHARFPHYGYSDMVTAEYRLVTEGLHVDHLRLLMGTSMGCMHAASAQGEWCPVCATNIPWMWGERNPGFMDALMPLACLPVPIARPKSDLAQNADRFYSLRSRVDERRLYKATPRPHGLTAAIYFLILAGRSPLQMQKAAPAPQSADEYLAHAVDRLKSTLDANDLLYAVASSSDYDPSNELEKITAPLMYINSADDFINPPELGFAERDSKRVSRGRFVLLPTTDETRGHGTHTQAKVWEEYLAQLLNESAH